MPIAYVVSVSPGVETPGWEHRASVERTNERFTVNRKTRKFGAAVAAQQQHQRQFGILLIFQTPKQDFSASLP